MKLLLVSLLLLCVASSVCAQDARWSTVATSSDGKDIYLIKMYSGQHSTNGAGEYITVVVGEDESNVTHMTDIMKWYVTDTDCLNGYGNLVMLDMNGNYKYEVPFASGSPTVSSAIAATICAVNASMNSGKSLSKAQS